MKYREYSIFYSWQSDAAPATNWEFIREALDDAVEQIKQRKSFPSSPRHRLKAARLQSA